MLSTILIVLLILLLIGALPTWPHSAGWGDAPGGFAWHSPRGRFNSSPTRTNLERNPINLCHSRRR
jgi:hypothetical protein